ncbi:MAG: purine-nucleoside phosphorylase [Elusimicrobiales bacterium]|nr:purine-nucleoside phosphorylase [Elusimicrobiales bacterium]
MKGKEMYEKIQQTAQVIKEKIKSFNPDYLVITGSGLKNAVPDLENVETISYSQIPNFPLPTVKGHVGELLYGRFKNKNVVVMRGRFHYYEGHPISFISFPVRLFNYCGASKLIVTAAVGSLKKNIKPGDIIIINNHINLMDTNPLIGNYYEKFGEMFIDMSEPYNISAIKKIEKSLKAYKIKYKKGVYVAVSGPCYETIAEARMYRIIGGDVMGMSVVPEVISAKQLKMNVFGVCWVSNYVPGIDDKKISHDDVIKMGDEAGKKIKYIIEKVIELDIL